MSSPDINYPEQPSYGEGMAEALKAQAEFLKGEGDFAGVGSLESLLPLEESIRKKTAQTDTDILRQTLLGGETKTRVVRDPETGRFGIPDGEVVTKSAGASAGRYQAIQSTAGRMEILDTTTGGVIPESTWFESLGYIEPTGRQSSWDRRGDGMGRADHPEYKLTQKGVDAGIQLAAGGRHTSNPGNISSAGGVGIVPMPAIPSGLNNSAGARHSRVGGIDHEAEIAGVFKTLSSATPTEIQQTFKFENPYTGEPLQEGQTITVRDETGMVDLLGDRRAVQEFETKTATQADVDAGLANEVGDSFVARRDTQRQAGFDDSGNFMGLAALAEDIQRGNLSRQREADLQDVSRLSGLYGEIMEE